MKMYKLLLMDLDETLFDYEKAEKYALEEAFKEIGFFNNGIKNAEEKYEKIKEDYKIINKKLWTDLEKGLIDKESLRTIRFSKVFEKNNIDYDANEISKIYIEKLGKGIFPFEETENLCKYLSEKYKICIVTNGIKEVQYPRIQNSAINPYIYKIVVSDDIGINKPDIRIFDYAINNEFDKNEVMMIGDSLNADVQGGINAGIDTCWVNLRKLENDTNIKPKYSITKLNELYDIL